MLKHVLKVKIISLVVASTRQKHRILNTSLSFELEFDNNENSRLENVIKDTKENPEEILINLKEKKN
jgi:hypothetical protein